MTRVFLLSPANLSGVRGRRILSGAGDTPLIASLHAGSAVPLGDVYAFVSSLYYRGKRAYARSFGQREDDGPVVLAITPSRGLLPDDEPVTLSDLEAFAACDVRQDNPAYREPLHASARALDEDLGGEGQLVLLGSIATPKYIEPLSAVFGARLHFPADFVGRGDMSRGGLLLRRVAADDELEYVSALTETRTGARPPKLGPRDRRSTILDQPPPERA